MALEYLESEDTGTVVESLKASADKLTELEFNMLAAEEAYNSAKAAYTEYATKVLPEAMLSQGVDLISTTQGLQIRVVTKTSASIKKGSDNGATSKNKIGAWLRTHNGENLIKSECIVDTAAKHLLEESGVPFKETMDINTNALKAFIIDALGQNGSPATITLDDMPEGLSFYQWNQAEVIHV